MDWAAERERYIAEFVEPRGLDPSYPVPAPLCEYIIGRTLDLGAGFTSVAVRLLGFPVVTVDHDEVFMVELRGYCQDRGIDSGEWITAAEWRNGHSGMYDTIILDHGPDSEDRERDVPLVLKRLAEGGRILLDDWRRGYRGRMDPRLRRKGYKVRKVDGEHRTIGIAMRGVT